MGNSLILEIKNGLKNLPMQIEPEALFILSRVEQFFQKRQIKAYLVGGFVRDMLIGRSTADIDVAIPGDALITAQDMAETLGGKYVLLDETNRIARVVLFQSDRDTSRVENNSEEKSSLLPTQEGLSGKQWYIDISTLAGDIRQDMARRDFTIDAMAVDLSNFFNDPTGNSIQDPFNGQKHLKQRIIKVVNENVFKDDPARLLRAIRLAAELGFTILPETKTLIRQNNILITRVAGERVREELVKILNNRSAGYFIRYLDTTGLLTRIMPELESSREVEQPKEHHWKVLDHSLETVRAVEFLLRQNSWEYTSASVLEAVPWSDKLNQYFSTEISNGSTHATLLKLAGLLHDIAKPETRIIDNGRLRFFGHTEMGAGKSAAILERLRFSKKEIRLIELMVRYHLRPTQMSHEGLPTQRAIYRYLRDTGPAGVDILFLSLADHLAARGPDLDMKEWQRHAGQVNCILTDCFRNEEEKPPKLIDGHDLINLFGMKPGPKIREILEAIKEAQAAGEITSREEALYYVKNRILYREQN